MNRKIFVLSVSFLLLAGVGCGRLNNRFKKSEPQQPTVPEPAAAAPLTKETINLDEAEIFLRTRDDVAPGQAEVTRQSLFAKSKDGQIVLLVKDVHDALKGELRAENYLVQKKDVPASASGTYLYFTQGEGLTPGVKIFAFNKKTRAFDPTVAIVQLAAGNLFALPQFSPDNRRVALFVQAELEQKKSFQVVYIGDLGSGGVTHRYVVGPKYSITTGATPAVHAATKWLSPDEFKIALLKPDGSDGPAQKPVDVVNVDVRTDASALSGMATNVWDPVAQKYAARHADGYDIFVVARFVHPKFGFSFALPDATAIKFAKNGNDARLVSALQPTVEFGRMIVQPGIPGVPLAPEKIETVMVDGVKAHLYHDKDQADGGNLDKLVVEFPDGSNSVYLGAPELPGQPMLDLKAIAASWKWKK